MILKPGYRDRVEQLSIEFNVSSYYAARGLVYLEDPDFPEPDVDPDDPFAKRSEPGYEQHVEGLMAEFGVPRRAAELALRYLIQPQHEVSIDDLILEDDPAVDRVQAEKQSRMLTESLSINWRGPGKKRPFWLTSDVGLFNEPRQNVGLSPDLMLAVDIAITGRLFLRENRSYFVWQRGKPPDLVLEMVSDRRGGEDSRKFDEYAEIGVRYYIIYDPDDRLGGGVLRCYELHDGAYQPLDEPWFEGVNLGLRLWRGTYENCAESWLRWYDRKGEFIPTGAEAVEKEKRRVERQRQRAEQEKQRADEAQSHAEQEKQRADEAQSHAEQEKQRADEAQTHADQEKQRADQEKQRAERLAARLRKLGLDPDEPTNGHSP